MKHLSLSLFLVLLATIAHAQPSTHLVENGRALQPVTVAAGASRQTQAAAATLAEYLKRITGADFETQTGVGKSGIAVSTANDFPALNLQKEFDTGDPARREEYVLRSTPTGVLLIGATDLAVEDAVWDFLYRPGYRQFFPSAHWEIVPHRPFLTVALNEKQKPDYYARRIWAAYGSWPENNVKIKAWNAKNRAVSGVALNTGHAYGGIILRNKAEFDAHPEYLGPVNGARKSPQTRREIELVQFDISNPRLRQLAVSDALRQFEKDPRLDSISMDPNDGSRWSHTSAEEKLGSISDRVTLLANEVADAVRKKYPGKYVGLYAYNLHSPPPSIRVHPGVVVSWDKDLPYRARAAKPEYIVKTIPHFYEKGARFLSAEASDNWGPNGLGYYLAARLIWDVNEAKNAPVLIEDFFDKSFGPAKEPMREYYNMLNGLNGVEVPPLSADYIGRLYRALDAAYRKTEDTGTRGRLDDLALYTRYLELYQTYGAARGKERQAAFENLIRFAWHIRDTQMIGSLAIYRTAIADKSVKVPPAADWEIPAADKAGQPLNPWKQDAVLTPNEIQELVRQGVENNKLRDFEMRDFPGALVPATPAQTGKAPSLRGLQDFYIWADGPGELKFTLTAGLAYTNRGPTKVQSFEGATVAKDGTGEVREAGDTAATSIPLASFEIPADKLPHEITFAAPRAGLYRMWVDDEAMGVRVDWPAGQRVVVKSTLGDTPGFGWRWTRYFYVPKSTTTLGGFASGAGLIRDPGRKVVYEFDKENNYFSVPVPPESRGKIWSVTSADGSVGLMTVPPYLARSAEELLLPEEVVAADAPKE
jgi:hypothetical protein